MNNPIQSRAEGEPAIGTPMEGGFYFGLTQEKGVLYRNIVAPKRYEIFGGITDPGVPDASNPLRTALSRTDSRSNTEALRLHSHVARLILEAGFENHSDWGIPAVDVHELLVRNFTMLPPSRVSTYVVTSGENGSSVPPGFPYLSNEPAVTSSEAFTELGHEVFGAYKFYLTSTPWNPDATYPSIYTSVFSDSSIRELEVNNNGAVRPVRRVPIEG
jgi:hypothetical protein